MIIGIIDRVQIHIALEARPVYEVKIGRCLLKDLLENRGLTQQQLSDLTKISKSQINEYISGKRKSMTLITAMKIATVLNCHIEELHDWKVIRKH